jgi:DNA-damage-inducible protein J
MSQPKTTFVRARTTPSVKKEAIKILGELGLSTSDAINIFLKQVVFNKGLPFEIKIPNNETLDAMNEAETSTELEEFDSAEKLFKKNGI